MDKVPEEQHGVPSRFGRAMGLGAYPASDLQNNTTSISSILASIGTLLSRHPAIRRTTKDGKDSVLSHLLGSGGILASMFNGVAQTGLANRLLFNDELPYKPAGDAMVGGLAGRQFAEAH
jgi:hypothetical protein